jgi:hypothetical protein
MEQPWGRMTAALSGSLLPGKRDVGVVRTIGADHKKRYATDATPERATKQSPCGSERATNLAPLDAPSDSHSVAADAAFADVTGAPRRQDYQLSPVALFHHRSIAVFRLDWIHFRDSLEAFEERMGGEKNPPNRSPEAP